MFDTFLISQFLHCIIGGAFLLALHKFVIVLGGFFGVIGMLLASPTMATITNIYKKKEKKFLNKNEGILERIDNIEDKEKDNKDKLKEDEKEDKWHLRNY